VDSFENTATPHSYDLDYSKAASTGRIRITPKADAEEKAIDRHERSGEEKPGGRFSERCPWFTFSPVILAHILAGDNKSASLGG